MLLKVLIALVFIAMVASLAAGAGFLLKDGGRSRRVLISLKLRVCLAALLLILLLYGFYAGGLGG
ncbi:DUF2909 domain-containing protein [Halomonas elongata]|uniref:DUF2909 domain protein n=2 Tax=Halomonas elongata TaxID=2746 RepID=E1VCN5_HALED|nr:DUF2909 family protein [Halomonas elongata]MBW5800815.1 DUF2909 domain-containing protein [Halomonas elongata]OBX36485.1 hypothetical protein A8U91_00827 [Halomonas elongata]RAW08867.1 DUF2909 domain-containing protein [Halomonas elongata]WBF19676.1 DUF2909 domain-containing protein [Halomonas elongata]WPU48541.1 DUF2909 domain-containing protein [Halomonas elongata DSM 2581]